MNFDLKAARVLFLMSAVICSASVLVAKAQTKSPELKPSVSALGYFTGDWNCSGKFDKSGKVIEAQESFQPDLEGAWLLFRHDDKPPFGYHALAEWGWNSALKQFVMTVQDSAGGVRLFHSQGWDAARLVWDGDSMGSGSEATQRFSFERLDDRHFQVSYFTLKDGQWSRVDSSTCSKQ